MSVPPPPVPRTVVTKKRDTPLDVKGAFSSKCFFSRGPGTLRVAENLHAEVRKKVVERITKACEDAGVSASGIALFRGGREQCRNDTDHELLFRQESFFHYLFGVLEPEWWGMLELPSGRATLFMPRLDEAYEIWMGKLKTPEHFLERYGTDAVYYVDEMKERILAVLAESSNGSWVHLLSGTNSDSGENIANVLPCEEGLPEGVQSRTDILFGAVTNSRVTKTAVELEVMRYASWVTSVSHVQVMRDVKPGMMEYQLESRFQYHMAEQGGARMVAYTCVCACGPNAAVLHYGHAGAPNDWQLQDGDMALLDMGAEYHCYCSDITCSYPVSGRFTEDQRLVYNAVLDAVRQVIAAMRPGVSWPDMHRLSWRVVLTHLRDGGVLTGGIDEMVDAGVGAVFNHAGLGHLIGIDTHDVGGYLKSHPQRIAEPGIKNLRTARVLEVGMCLTVEPGCYFVDALIEPALADPVKAKFIVPEVLQRFRRFGGVRIEDVVVVTETGIENYTLCPRTVEEIEDVMAGGAWPPARDAAPWLHRKWATVDRRTGTMVKQHVPESE